MISQKDLKQINKLKGKVRGETLRTDIKYVENSQGKKEAEKVKKEMKKIEPDLDYDKIEGTTWHPLRWRILSLLLIKNYFDWDEKEIMKMGYAAPRNSFIAKVVLRYFVSFEKTCREAPNYWEKHYSVGKLEIAKFNRKERKMGYILRDFSGHPVLCVYLKGYFKSIVELASKNKASVKELKCTYRGDKYHHFEIYW